MNWVVEIHWPYLETCEFTCSPYMSMLSSNHVLFPSFFFEYSTGFLMPMMRRGVSIRRRDFPWPCNATGVFFWQCSYLTYTKLAYMNGACFVLLNHFCIFYCLGTRVLGIKWIHLQNRKLGRITKLVSSLRSFRIFFCSSAHKILEKFRNFDSVVTKLKFLHILMFIS